LEKYNIILIKAIIGAAVLEKYDPESANVISFLGHRDRKVMTEPRDASEYIYITKSYMIAMVTVVLDKRLICPFRFMGVS